MLFTAQILLGILICLKLIDTGMKLGEDSNAKYAVGVLYPPLFFFLCCLPQSMVDENQPIKKERKPK